MDTEELRQRGVKKYCSITECPHYLGTTDANIRFFRPPESAVERAKWAEIILGKRGIDIPNRYQMCNLHFKSDDIITYRMIQRIPMAKLKNGAVPLTFHCPKTEPDPLADVKLVDIEELKRAAPINAAFVENNPNSSKRMCEDCIYLDIKLQQANLKIASLQAKVSALTATNKKLKSGGPFDKKPFDHSTRKCELCLVLVKKDAINRHLCLDHNSITCTLCSEQKLFKSTKSFLDHLIEHAQIKHKTMFKCDKCSIAYPMEVLLECHKKSHVDRDELIEIDESEESTIIDEFTEQNPLDTKERLNENDELASLSESIISELFKPPKSPEPMELDEQPVVMTQLKRVISSKSHNFKPYKCGKCGEAFEKPTQLSRHMNKKCAKPSSSRLHRNSSDRANKFRCNLCKLELETEEALNNHQIEHKNYRKCEICKINANPETHLCSTENSILCEYCDESFTVTTKLLKHLEEAHEQKKLHRCEKCPKFFSMIRLRELHMEQHMNEPCQAQFICKICSKNFANKNGLYIHTKYSHMNDKPHLCDECGKSFTTQGHLAVHKKSISHGEKPHIQCPKCPKKFVRLSGLKRHSDVHRDDKYVCNICQAELISLLGYRDHMKRHRRTDADRKYACKICPRKFFDATDLKQHQRVHTNEKTYKCRFCEQSYKYSGDLNKHLRTHLGGKIHECPKCPIRFQYPLELQKHLFEHYKDEKETGMVE